ncbi:TerC family protein [Mucilaginibacter sp. FT3.2]|uniref:TerC family protein n=1 Tax=Mucilaginibacter sp. FT3.2 TaxID=2723090 RepID=UPI00160F5457|nr:TerC family protein [Mucilaginibacter sp. FT3.2]MBB6232287.1 YkoY family integral membrane protein [Mucilaginibacter sp. FT3.2]
MDFLHTVLGPDLKAGMLIILNLIVIESLLSVDNAAVLATMVLDLPKDQRKKALRYGIIGAYVLRGVCLFLAAWLVKIWWLKPIGGLYLLYLSFDYFKGKIQAANAGGEGEEVDKSKNWLYKSTVGVFGIFWATVALVELMDLAFSIDNVFAAVAFTDHVILIYIGVFIGILAMRFVAQAFVKLMEKFTFLETVAFIVIGVLGIKLSLSLYIHFYPKTPISEMLTGEHADIATSIFTVGIFVIPVLTSLLFNFPKRHTIEPEVAEAAEDVLDKQ